MRRGNAARNGLDNTEFFVGKAEEVLPEWYEKRDSKEERHADVIVVDPPRKGCDERTFRHHHSYASRPHRVCKLRQCNTGEGSESILQRV